MSFFKKLFNKSADTDSSSGQEKPATPAGQEEKTATPAEKFEMEFQSTIPRYLCKPGIDVDLKMRNKETDAVMTFAESFPEQFAEWQTVQSLPDRRGIIYKILDEIMGRDLHLWQVIERFVDDRYPEHALKIAEEHVQLSDLSSPDFFAATAKAYVILTNYNQAESQARKALELDGGHIRAKIALADALHEMCQFDQAHEIYNEVLKARMPQSKENITMSFAHLVGFNGDILPSAIYTIAWLKHHPDTNMDTWNWANDEFYYSPHFRAQFSYYLLQQKETLKGLAKLYNLTKEMPWYKEGVLNCWSVINQLGMSANMPDEIAYLEGIMKKNQWDPNDPGLHKMEL
ncbi:hypothetical protein A4H97_18785 [Niastella yeongjuensis]|uniref:Uncharacterized protein n=1 Tax=Niastella yeongjuensis TaxID=354355 RepID=A0A1V9DYL4_9BACT|nr:tetratricopeptide repeat protein [Niastella yeongjuensis]OQP38765.1 hypothetical protein A4H97_18785 [Niastella yeongjuensis]SEO33447.1 hypothetical protein SAMN05660816_02646 [Niastella yeongjuensis]